MLAKPINILETSRVLYRIVLTNIFLMRLLSISPNKFEYNQNIESFISSLFILSIIFNI